MISPKKKTILVTGGCGFIGSHIVDKLIKNQNEVIVLDNLSTGSIKNLNSDAILYQGDARNEFFIQKIFEQYKFDYVIHQAAKINTNVLQEVPLNDIRNTLESTIVLAKNCIKHNVKNLIFASSVAVYGRPKSLPVKESSSLNPIYSYGIAKKVAEEYLKYFNIYYNLNYQVLRYSNVYGPRQPIFGEVGVIAIFTDRIIQEKELIIYGDGEQQRDYIFVEDIVRGLVSCALLGNPGEAYNLASGAETSIKDLADLINELTKNKQPHDMKEPRDWDNSGKRFGSTEKSMKELSFKTHYDLKEGLKKTVAWTQQDKIQSVIKSNFQRHVKNLPELKKYF